MLIAGGSVPPALVEMIAKKYKALDANSFICTSCFSRYRAEYVRDLLEEERGEVTSLDEEVIAALRDHELLAENVNTDFDERLTMGQRVADRVAAFGGSWYFIGLFGALIAVWMLLNVGLFISRPYDPYPFILLNLVLSTLAAFQAPVIMMSQNRQAARDRLQAEHDYQVNLKAEIEIRLLHSKLDQLLSHQWKRLIEIQQVQMDLMEEIARNRNN